MSANAKTVFRGALVDKADLIALFKFLDEHTDKKYINQPYFDPKSSVYGKKTQYKGYRPVRYGTYAEAEKTFTYKGKPVSRNTIYSRIQTYPNGVHEGSKPQQAGARPAYYNLWEQTPTYKLIMEKIGVDKNSVKAARRNPEKYKETFKKRGKYLNAGLLAWRALGAKKDVLDFDENDWLVIWGKDPKVAGLCHPLLQDKQTGLIQYGHSTPLRWFMKHSRDPIVVNFIVTEDKRFDTTDLKREAGQHLDKFFTEEQIFLLPQAISKPDTLILTYFGILFGGRFSALSDITPEHFVYIAE